MTYKYAYFRKLIQEQEEKKETLQDHSLYLPEEKFNTAHSSTTGEFSSEGGFRSPDEMKDAYASAVSSLSSEQEEEIRNYTNISSGYLNTALRTGTSLDDEDKTSIDTLQSALLSATAPFAMTVTRGMKQHNLPGMPKYLDSVFEEFRKNIGKPFVDPAFGSTTTDEAPPGTITSNPDMVLHIAVPKGAHGLYIDAISTVPGEHEFLVPHGTTYTVKSTTKKENGKYFVELQMHTREGKSNTNFEEKNNPNHSSQNGEFTTGETQGFTTLSLSEKDTHLQNAYKDWINNLTRDQKKAIETYIGPHTYKEINGHLRHGRDASEETKATIQKIIEALKNAKTPDDMVVYRGMPGARWQKVIEDSLGKKFLDKAFVSTSLQVDEKGAIDFLHPEGIRADDWKGGGVLAEIHVPKGTHAAYVQSLASQYAGEHELLLHPGVIFHVKSVTRKMGIIHAQLEVISTGANEHDLKTKNIAQEDRLMNRFCWSEDDIVWSDETEHKFNSSHSSTTGQFISTDDGDGGVHADVMASMPAHIAHALSQRGALTKNPDGTYSAQANGKSYHIVPVGSEKVAFSQVGASRIAQLAGASDVVPVIHGGTMGKQPVVLAENTGGGKVLDEKSAEKEVAKLPPAQLTKATMLEYLLGIKQDQPGHYLLDGKTGKINFTQLSSALVKHDAAIKIHSFLMKVIGNSRMKESIDHGILGKFLSQEHKATLLSEKFAASPQAHLGFQQRFNVLHQLASMKHPTWEDFFKMTTHPESETGGMPPKHGASEEQPHEPKKPSSPYNGRTVKPHSGQPAPRRKPGHRGGHHHKELDLSLYLPEIKYNPAHDAGGKFTTTEGAHLLVHRDGSREKGPAHPDNQKKDILEHVRPPDTVLQKYAIQGAAFSETHAATHNMSVDDYNKAVDSKAQELLKNAEPWMRVRPTVLSKILDDGKFKSQFETNTSGGIMDHDSRSEAETDLFGYPSDLAKEKRPLYGYLSDDPSGASVRMSRHGSFDSVDEYGTVAVRFKPEIKERTTWTGDDSLGMGGYLLPGSTLHPDHTSFSTHGPDPLTYQKLSDIRAYPEAQYHGGLDTSHIAQVTFKNATDLSPGLEAQLQKHGIPYHVVGQKSVEQFEEKYNPAHDVGGKFTTTESAHLLVHRDGTREKGPAHPDNQIKAHQKVEAKYTNPEDIPFVKHYMETGEGPSPYSGTSEDPVLAAIYKAQGFDGKPDLVEDGALTAHIQNGEAELFRGIDGLEHTKQYQTGDHFAGKGIFGNGSYTALTTPSITNPVNTAEGIGKEYGTHVLRMSVLPTTNAIDYGRLQKEWSGYITGLNKKSFALERSGKLEEAHQLERLAGVASDPGRYAAMKGYDAVYVDQSNNKFADFLVIHNRTATRVQKTLLKGNLS